ncbi:MAG: VWA domain-containing protein [Epulopiscium sp.]|nr:VWA domain-containing protein [Candidatus Epulonipiscium sp.]
MNFYNPWGFLGFLLIPIIILMYILRQKYEEIEVPSLFLWEQALSSQEVYNPWQKLKKNILLFIQLIIAALLILALSKPYIAGEVNKSGNYILILDQSVDMQAEDEEPNRFEKAKEKMYQLIKTMEPNAIISVVVMGKNPHILINQSTDKHLITNKIKDIKVLNSRADKESTIELVRTLYKQKNGKVYLFSDNNLPMKGLDINYIKLGQATDNCGITLLSHSIEDKQIAVLVKVKNFSNKAKNIPVSLYGDEELIDIKKVEILPNEEKNVFFSGVSRDVHILKAEIDSKDILQIDNTMYDVVHEETREKVLLATEQNMFLEHMLSILPQVELYKKNIESTESLEGYHLYIFDGIIPATLPQDGHILIFNPPKDNPLVHVEGDIEVGAIISSEGRLLEFIKRMDFDIAKTRKMLMPNWAEAVISTQDTPLIIAGEQNNQKIIICGFDLHQTDLPLKKEFPIFMYNTIQWYIPQKIYNLDKITAGDTIEFQLSPDVMEVKVLKPKGMVEQLAPPFPIQPYGDTDEIGIYILEQKRETSSIFHSFAVNPPIGEGITQLKDVLEVDVTKNDIVDEGNKNIKNSILLLVLIFVGIEWWVYISGL